MKKRVDFDFDIVNFPFIWMVTFSVLPRTKCTFMKFFGLLEWLIM